MSNCDLLERQRDHTDGHTQRPLNENDWKTVVAEGLDSLESEDRERVALMFAILDGWDNGIGFGD